MAKKGTDSRKRSDRRAFDARQMRNVRIIDGTFGLLRTIVRSVCWLIGVYIAGGALAPFASHKTELSAVFNAAIAIKADRYILAIALAITGGGWWQERRKKGKLNESSGAYASKLEKMIDAGRTSSGILKSGKPNKEDADAL
jgi:hypothetical protein